MTETTPSSINLTNLGSLQGVMKIAFDKFLQGVDGMLPARVISYDAAKGTVTLQPLVMMVTSDDASQSRATITGVHVYRHSGGGFVISFPLNVGDIGWIKACDRDISLFKQSLKESRPNTFRKHNFSDAIFFPDNMRGWTINEDGLVIQTNDGNQCIAILDNQVKIKSDTKVVIESPLLEITGAIVQTGVSGATTASFKGNVNVEDGSVLVTNGDVEADGITLKTHTHGGVQTGAGSTGIAQ